MPGTSASVVATASVLVSTDEPRSVALPVARRQRARDGVDGRPAVEEHGVTVVQQLEAGARRSLPCPTRLVASRPANSRSTRGCMASAPP